MNHAAAWYPPAPLFSTDCRRDSSALSTSVRRGASPATGRHRPSRYSNAARSSPTELTSVASSLPVKSRPKHLFGALCGFSTGEALDDFLKRLLGAFWIIHLQVSLVKPEQRALVVPHPRILVDDVLKPADHCRPATPLLVEVSDVHLMLSQAARHLVDDLFRLWDGWGEAWQNSCSDLSPR